jgi:hypothetical protein
MLGLFFFGLQYELTINSMNRFINYHVFIISHISFVTTKFFRNPEKWGLLSNGPADAVKSKSLMPFHHRAMNYVHDHPFNVIVMLGIPLAGSIFHQQYQLKHFTLSQRVMHSRVYAQGGILAILGSTMLVKSYMDRNGKFPEN